MKNLKSSIHTLEDKLVKPKGARALPTSANTARILRSRGGILGVSKVNKKPPTEPKPFRLSSSERGTAYTHPTSTRSAPSPTFNTSTSLNNSISNKRSKGKEEPFQFRALPMPNFGLRPPKPIRESSRKPLTSPKPFRLLTDSRAAAKSSTPAAPPMEDGDGMSRPSKRRLTYHNDHNSGGLNYQEEQVGNGDTLETHLDVPNGNGNEHGNGAVDTIFSMTSLEEELDNIIPKEAPPAGATGTTTTTTAVPAPPASKTSSKRRVSTKPIPFKLSQPKKRTSSRLPLKDATQLNSSSVGRGAGTGVGGTTRKLMKRSVTKAMPFRFRTDERAAANTTTATNSNSNGRTMRSTKVLTPTSPSTVVAEKV